MPDVIESVFFGQCFYFYFILFARTSMCRTVICKRLISSSCTTHQSFVYHNHNVQALQSRTAAVQARAGKGWSLCTKEMQESKGRERKEKKSKKKKKKKS
jgi:hypothetical protein